MKESPETSKKFMNLKKLIDFEKNPTQLKKIIHQFWKKVSSSVLEKIKSKMKKEFIDFEKSSSTLEKVHWFWKKSVDIEKSSSVFNFFYWF